MSATMTITAEQDEQLRTIAAHTAQYPGNSPENTADMRTVLAMGRTVDAQVALVERYRGYLIRELGRAEELMSERFIVVETDQPYQSWMVEDTASRKPNNSDLFTDEFVPCYLQQFNDRTDARRLADHLNLRDEREPGRSPWELFDPAFPKPKS